MAYKHLAPPPTSHISQRLSRRTLLRIIVLALAVYIVAAGFAGLQLSLHALRDAELGYVAAAWCAVLLSYVCAAITLLCLARRRLRFGRTLLVLAAGGLVNRLLPGGLGGLGLNAFYLKKMGHTLPTATAIVTLNNALGFVGNALLIGVAIMLTPHVPSLRFPAVPFWWLLAVAALLIVGMVVMRHNQRFSRAGKHTFVEITAYLAAMMRRPYRPAFALLSSMGLTASHATALYFVLVSLQVTPAWLAALFAVSAGSLASVAVPTPGGIGGTEAGIAGMLLLLGQPANIAVAAAVLYRGLTYWLPLLPGYLALRIVEKRYI